MKGLLIHVILEHTWFCVALTLPDEHCPNVTSSQYAQSTHTPFQQLHMCFMKPFSSCLTGDLNVAEMAPASEVMFIIQAVV